MPHEEDDGTLRIEIGDGRQDQPRKRVLVVDDSRHVRLLHNLALTQGGYYADTAENGAVAWSMLRRNHYDLLITDHHMPKVSGVELLEKLNASRMDLPVIMVTTEFPEFEFRSRPWLRPPTALLKPVTGEDLLGAVQMVLSTAEAGRKAAGSNPP